MAWDFETDPEFQKKLDWIEEFMREEVEPLSHLGMAVHGPAGREKFIKPLQEKVKAQGLWEGIVDGFMHPESLTGLAQ